MAVIENPYLVAKPLDPMFSVGKKVRIVQAKIALTNSSADNDVVILANGLPATARIHRVMLPKGSKALKLKEGEAAIISMGFYAAGTHKELDADAVVKGKSFTNDLGNIDLVGEGIESFDASKDIATLLSIDAGNVPAQGFDFCAKIEKKGSVVGNIELDIYVEQD